MRFHQHQPFTALLAGAALIAGVSCSGDRMPTGPRLTPPAGNATLWDGSQVGGNPNVFFLPPLVPDPSGLPTYGKNPFQSGLPVQIEVACLTAPSGSSCAGRGLARTPTKESTSDQQYMLNWDTKAPGFDPGFVFRVKVWIGSTNVAFADVVLISNASPKNRVTNDDIPLPDGRTLPIKVHVQTGWNCVNQASCITQVVTNTPPSGQSYTIVQTQGGANAAFFPANWFDTQGGRINQVLVTIEDVTSQLSQASGGPGCSLGKTAMLSQEHCVRFTIDPQVTITTQPGNPAIVATCIDGITGAHQQLVKYDVSEVPEFLQNVTPPSPFVCPEGGTIGSTSPSSNRLVNLASATLSKFGHALKSLVVPKSAYAIDLGVGGALDSGSPCCSLVAFGQAITMSNVSPLTQTASVGGSVPERVQIKTVHDGSFGVAGQTITCQVGSGGGTVSVPATTDANGITSCPWVLGPDPGINTLQVIAQGIDDCTAFNQECVGIIAVQADPETRAPVRVTLNRSLTFTAEAVAPSTLISCATDASGGDLIDRGFYVGNYPGLSLNQATLNFSADTPGEYAFSLTARRGTFDGQVIGVANAKVVVANGRNSFTPTTFFFPSPFPSIDPGSTVTFALTQLAGPSTDAVFYEVPSNGDTACPVTQTNGTTPPLDTFRRNGVNIQIQGATQPVIIP